MTSMLVQTLTIRALRFFRGAAGEVCAASGVGAGVGPVSHAAKRFTEKQSSATPRSGFAGMGNPGIARYQDAVPADAAAKSRAGARALVIRGKVIRARIVARAADLIHQLIWCHKILPARPA